MMYRAVLSLACALQWAAPPLWSASALSTRDAKPRSPPALPALPAVTNSLVNLGKMDIAFYINSNPQDAKPAAVRSSLSEAGEERCPCSGLRGPPGRGPADALAGILSNDVFHREQTMSALCCDSHEVREDSIVFEFGPKQRQVLGPAPPGRLPAPLLLDSLGLGKPAQLAGKHKIIELLFFPTQNRKDFALDLGKITKKHDVHEGIKIVGDKEIRNDFKNLKLAPPLPSSVKKDLTVQENKSKVAFNAPDNADAVANTSQANVV